MEYKNLEELKEVLEKSITELKSYTGADIKVISSDLYLGHLYDLQDYLEHSLKLLKMVLKYKEGDY